MRQQPGWNRRDVVLLTLVSVSEFVVIIACAFVGNMKNGGGHLMTLMEGALVGGLIAMGAAALVLVLAQFLRFRDAVFTQAVLSILLVLVHALAIFDVSARMSWGFEPVDQGVEIGRLAYVAAGILQAIAAITSIGRLRATGGRSRRARR